MDCRTGFCTRMYLAELGFDAWMLLDYLLLKDEPATHISTKNQTRKSPNIAVRAYRNVCGRAWRQAQAFEREALAKQGRTISF